MNNQNFKIKIVYSLLLMCIVLLVPSLVHAQPHLPSMPFGGPSPFGAPSFTDGTTDAPIDGGLSLLVVAGIGYGSKRIKAHRNKKNEVDK